ncbi:MAG: DUF192 domain-containing protein [Acidimicrobiales bacterium]
MTTNGLESKWLVLNSRVLATVEIASSRRDRRKGLLGRHGIEGALLLSPARSVHTFGMRFSIDVAHLNEAGEVLRITTMKPNRLGAFVFRSRSVIETEANELKKWGVASGDVVEIR